MQIRKNGAQRSIRRHLLISIVAALFLIGGMGGWAATTELAGAVIAPGLLVAESSVKRVQHPSGGVVAELNVVEGDMVEAGEVLIRLDDTSLKANLGIIVKSLQQLEARQARLEAERDSSPAVAFPEALTALASDPEVAELMAAETKLFELRRTAREGQKAQLAERVSQLTEEIIGIEAQIAAKERESALLEADLVGMRSLLGEKLIASQRVSDLDRELARTEGELGQLVAAIAQARGKITEIELQIIQVDQNLRSEVAIELSNAQAKAAELGERRIAGESELGKTAIRAPQNGQVHQLAIHTVGGVAPAGETLMLIVPIADALIIEVSIAPQDIDQVHIGQSAVVRFSAFNVRTTPELNGTVTRLSPDLTVDERTGLGHYTARIELNDGEPQRLEGLTLTSGMPVEGFIQTGQRTALSYLTKPLADQIMRAFRSD